MKQTETNHTLVLGNIHNNTLAEIASGEPRKKLIKQLKEGKFEEIGNPCNTVVCCHNYKIGGEKNERIRKT